MDVKTFVTSIYPISKAIQLKHYLTPTNELKGNLDDNAMYNLYDILYGKSKSDIATIKQKLAISKDRKFVNVDTRNRFNEMLKELEDNSENIDSITEEIESLKRTSIQLNNFYSKREEEKNIISLTNYLNTFSDITVEKVRERYKTRDKKILRVIQSSLDISIGSITNQYHILEKEDSKCSIWRVSTTHNDILYASALVIYDKERRNIEDEEYIAVEEMTKYPIPMLAEILFPEYRNEMPDINGILLPVIEDIARKLKVRIVYVRYIDKSIEKYGYVRTDYEWSKRPQGKFEYTEDRYMKDLSIVSHSTVKSKFFESMMEVDNKFSISIILKPILMSQSKEFEQFETFKAKCDIKLIHCTSMRVIKQISQVEYLIEYNQIKALLKLVDFPNTFMFSQSICNQHKASERDIAPRIINYWLREKSPTGVLISEYIESETLTEDKRIEMYLKALEKALYQNFTLRIYHGNLTSDNVLVIGDEVLFTNYENSSVFLYENMNTDISNKITEDPFYVYDWLTLTLSFSKVLNDTKAKGVLNTKLNTEKKWSTILLMLYNKYKRMPTYSEVYRSIESMLL